MSGGPGILLVGNHPPPFGGVPAHVEALARHLTQRGWRVHVLSGTGPGGTRAVDGYHVHRQREVDKYRQLLQRPPRVPREELLWSGRGPATMRYGLISVANAIAGLVRRHDLQLISAYHLLSTALPASWAARTTGVPLATTVFGELYADTATHLRRRRDVEAIVRHSRLLLSCSRHCAESFRVIGMDVRADVEYYGVDIERFAVPDRVQARQRLGVRSEDPVVAFVGRMVADMGLSVLLEAAPELWHAGAQLIVAGAVGELTSAAHRAAARSGGRMVVLPDVPASSLPDVYAAADVVAAPSVNERACLGLAIAEAMASGRPVVAADAGGTSEVLVDGTTGVLVPPGDGRALGRALIALLADPERRTAMGEAGLDRARTVFDNRIVCAAIERRFAEVVRTA